MTAPESAPRAIRTRPAPACVACGSAGASLHEDLEDRLFGAPGRWRMVRCSNPDCGALWLDPAPHPDDLPLAYARYYTHGGAHRRRGALAAAVRWRAMRGWYADRWGAVVRASALDRLLARAFVRTPELREHLERACLLHAPRPGERALDVGCGEGETVAVLASLGWEAEGVDFDAAAIERARARGLRARAGTLEEQRYPDGAFALVGMHHVLEHLPGPSAALAECRRILAPGGRLVLATPNASSLGHRRFGRDWRGLEPPRHLQVLTPAALRALAGGAGLAVVSLTAPVLGAAFASAESRRIAGDAAARLGDEASRAFAREEATAAAADPWAGEELLLVAEAAR